MFPLSLVLFPGVSIPLHIFEERYKLMINECVDLEQPLGIVLDHASPSDSPPHPYKIGTSCIVTEVEQLDEGEMNIIVRGGKRFRILEMLDDRPYPAANVEYLEPDAADVEPELVRDITEMFSSYLGKLLTMAGHKVALLEMPEEPEELASIVASLLTISLEERQALLEELDVSALLTRQREILEEQIELLESQTTPKVGVARPLDLDDYLPDISYN